MAWLKHSSSLNPIPPRFFGRHNFSHDTQWIFLWLGSELHQKFAMMLASFLRRVLGSRKLAIAKLGIAEAVDLMSTSFPPCDRFLIYQASGLFCVQNWTVEYAKIFVENNTLNIVIILLFKYTSRLHWEKVSLHTPNSQSPKAIALTCFLLSLIFAFCFVFVLA